MMRKWTGLHSDEFLTKIPVWQKSTAMKNLSNPNSPSESSLIKHKYKHGLDLPMQDQNSKFQLLLVRALL